MYYGRRCRIRDRLHQLGCEHILRRSASSTDLSQVLGLVAINWLIIADQSDKSIFDKDCMTLAQLHSDAVDYPKSSTPVPLQKIPRLKSKTKPDWNQPETMNDSRSADYYESQRAIGRLFRAIELPALDIVRRVNRTQRQKMREGGDDDD